jgi:hypothetical protein
MLMSTGGLLVPLVLATAIHAGIVVSVDSTNPSLASLAALTRQSVFATSWTQTGSYKNLSIAANLQTFGPTVTGAYLTDSIDAGTSIANQIAMAPFSVPPVSGIVEYIAIYRFEFGEPCGSVPGLPF